MTFKPFAVHYHRQRRRSDNAVIRSKPRGFTAWVTPGTDQRTINVQITHCAYRDDFCKKEGIRIAKEQEIIEINPRELPNVLNAALDYMGYLVEPRYWYYLWKYLL